MTAPPGRSSQRRHQVFRQIQRVSECALARDSASASDNPSDNAACFKSSRWSATSWTNRRTCAIGQPSSTNRRRNCSMKSVPGMLYPHQLRDAGRNAIPLGGQFFKPFPSAGGEFVIIAVPAIHLPPPAAHLLLRFQVMQVGIDAAFAKRQRLAGSGCGFPRRSGNRTFRGGPAGAAPATPGRRSKNWDWFSSSRREYL